VAAAVAPGVRTADLDAFAEEYLRKRGATPAFKGYRDYPFSLCVSVNEEVVHGLPSGRQLRDGDIVSLDLGTIVDGYYGDSALTVAVGQVSAEAGRLLRVTQEALMRGIGAARLGGHLSDISHAVQGHVEAHGFSVVRIFVGHGIGKALHEDPQIPNYGPPGRGPRLKPGMVLAIEPMVNAGGPEVVILPDNWTAVTADRSLSAHFEHTIALTEQGVEILTQP
jgi:methionyl aminopeptidase